MEDRQNIPGSHQLHFGLLSEHRLVWEDPNTPRPSPEAVAPSPEAPKEVMATLVQVKAKLTTCIRQASQKSQKLQNTAMEGLQGVLRVASDQEQHHLRALEDQNLMPPVKEGHIRAVAQWQEIKAVAGANVVLLESQGVGRSGDITTTDVAAGVAVGPDTARAPEGGGRVEQAPENEPTPEQLSNLLKDVPEEAQKALQEAYESLDPAQKGVVDKHISGLDPQQKQIFVDLMNVLTPAKIEIIENALRKPDAEQRSALAEAGLTQPEIDVVIHIKNSFEQAAASLGRGPEGAPMTPEQAKEVQRGAQEALRGINEDLAAGKEIKESDKMIAMGRVMMSHGVTVSERGNQLVADAPPTGENAGMERGLIKFMGIIMLIGGYIQKFKEAKEGSKGEKKEGAGEGKEQVDPVQARVDNLNNHPGNTFAKFSIESRDEVKDGGIHEKHKDLRIGPKAGTALNLDQATLDSMKLIAGADVTDPSSILIKDVTEAKLTEIEGYLKSALNSSILNKMRGKQGNTENSLRGVEKALDQQGVWVQGEGDKSMYKYIVKGGSIVAYNTDTRAWYLLNKDSGQFEMQQPGKYFNVQTGQFDALPRGKKYNTETNTLEDKNVEDLKKGGVDFITKEHKGVLEGDKYFVEIPWDADDVYVHFNEGTSKWEVKEQDEATYHVPGDGGMPDEWSGDGLKKVTAIVEGLRKLNAGET